MRVSLSGGRASGVPFHVQSETCETRMAKQDKVCDLDNMDNCNNRNIRSGKNDVTFNPFYMTDHGISVSSIYKFHDNSKSVL